MCVCVFTCEYVDHGEGHEKVEQVIKCVGDCVYEKSDTWVCPHVYRESCGVGVDKYVGKSAE